ncbi:MAG: hypothetical protein JWO76_1970 [Nocardioides sp.]|nr:hypothetical protein [Nocardioides sp.]
MTAEHDALVELALEVDGPCAAAIMDTLLQHGRLSPATGRCRCCRGERGVIAATTDAITLSEATIAVLNGQIAVLGEQVRQGAQDGMEPVEVEMGGIRRSIHQLPRLIAEQARSRRWGEVPIIVDFGSGPDPDTGLLMAETNSQSAVAASVPIAHTA